jgi:glycerol uptake facilitator protein
MPLRELPVYIVGQLLGAIAASGVLWLLLSSSVEQSVQFLQVGFAEPSAVSAIFVETYPNTANAVVSTPVAFLAEALGTFTLVCLIFALTEGANLGRPSPSMAPLFIGLTVTIIICVIGPLTNAGLNPARDMGPRIVGAFVGWSSFAFSWEILLVYVGGPLVGGALAALLTVTLLEPISRKRLDKLSSEKRTAVKEGAQDERCIGDGEGILRKAATGQEGPQDHGLLLR